MIIRSVKLRAATQEGDFGFSFNFARNLTVIRAKNSSGKSTLFNSLLYCLGMEELIGGRNEKVLPYAVKEHFEYDGRRILVTASEVLLEIESRSGEVVTLRRAIRDSIRDPKLIEVFSSAHLTQGMELIDARPTYVHDSGGAQRPEGFHHFLESFLGLDLPQVPTTSGGETKLYLQTIFAAMAVEQKRGWTDYIANIPFYGIRDARTRVVEFLLGLGVFETNAVRNRLNAESVEIDMDWRKVYDELRREAVSLNATVENVPTSPTPLFDDATGSVKRLIGSSSVALPEYIAQLRVEHATLQNQALQYHKTSGAEAIHEVALAMDELQNLSVLHERATTLHAEQRMSLREYEKLLAETNEDLERNKTAAKLRDLGAKHNIATATGRCPTCNQPVDDTLLAEVMTGPQMDLATNIAYLDSQRRMLLRQIAGIRAELQVTEVRVTELATRIASKRDLLTTMRGDVTSGASESKAIVRRQVQIEAEVEALERLQSKASELFTRLSQIAKRLSLNQAARRSIPKESYTEADIERIGVFQMQFRANAGSFGYESAPIRDIEIGKDTLVPCLAQMELREIRTDIKSDSSASDFVRLIWSYLLALHQTSSTPSSPGNHPGLLMFDEPGQHSMAVDSQHALLKQLASESNLQSIVAASFDEAEEVFRQATEGIQYSLIEWGGKLIRPLS
ncbi:AAA family ATPase [Achromobacter xylosoxidans]|uniref:AAA family ATPase n=1 Tax=Alcaligenes xylosoxydans xylosoxydans TaxID=85698 RepID=UPI001EEBEE83|nr:AAA family ATPase [Achromobacter xylosoxidans]